MDPNPSAPSILDIPPPPRGIFGTRIPSTVVFTVGVLLFLLPFAVIKCNNTPLMQNTGLGIAIGGEWKVASENMLAKFGETVNRNSSQYANTKRDPNVYALTALALGLAGLILSIPNARGAFSVAIFTGVLAACSLIGLWIDLRKDMHSASLGASEISLRLQMTPWFFISVISFLAGAFFCFKRLQATTK